MPSNKKEGNANGSGGSGKMTKEEERLLLESSRQVTGTTSALFYGNAFIVSALPVWLYWRVQVMDPLTFGIFFVAFTLITTWFVAFAYRKMKVSLKHKIAVKRENAVSKEVLAELNQSSGKKLTKAEKDERVAWKKNEVAEGEATTFAIFYINTLFLFLVLCTFFFMRSFNPIINYTATTGITSFVLVLLSTGV